MSRSQDPEGLWVRIYRLPTFWRTSSGKWEDSLSWWSGCFVWKNILIRQLCDTWELENEESDFLKASGKVWSLNSRSSTRCSVKQWLCIYGGISGFNQRKKAWTFLYFFLIHIFLWISDSDSFMFQWTKISASPPLLYSSSSVLSLQTEEPMFDEVWAQMFVLSVGWWELGAALFVRLRTCGRFRNLSSFQWRWGLERGFKGKTFANQFWNLAWDLFQSLVGFISLMLKTKIYY